MSAKAATLAELLDEVRRFRDARDWRQFHTPRNLILALAGEVGEVAQLVRWSEDAELTPERVDPELAAGLREELADVTSLLLLLADALDIDLADALRAKLARNEQRYPIETSYGSAHKARRAHED